MHCTEVHVVITRQTACSFISRSEKAPPKHKMGVSVDAYAMLGNLFSRGIGVSKFSSREWRVLGVGSQSSVLVCVLSGGDSWKTQRSRLDVSDEV